MDALTVISRSWYECLVSLGFTPEQAQELVQEQENKHRRSLGGAHHHFSRVPQLPAKVRVIELLEQGLTPKEIEERVGVTAAYVRMVRAGVK